MQNSDAQRDPSVAIRVGPEELVVRRRYETASILNDFLIALWFLVGSVMFLYPALKELGAWLFIVGSAQFMARPMIRLANRLHLKRIPPSSWEM